MCGYFDFFTKPGCGLAQPVGLRGSAWHEVSPRPDRRPGTRAGEAWHVRHTGQVDTARWPSILGCLHQSMNRSRHVRYRSGHPIHWAGMAWHDDCRDEHASHCSNDWLQHLEDRGPFPCRTMPYSCLASDSTRTRKDPIQGGQVTLVSPRSYKRRRKDPIQGRQPHVAQDNEATILHPETWNNSLSHFVYNPYYKHLGAR